MSERKKKSVEESGDREREREPPETTKKQTELDRERERESNTETPLVTHHMGSRRKGQEDEQSVHDVLASDEAAIEER